VTIGFPLVGEKAETLGLAGVSALAWTTTPWTLPTNSALAVGPAIEYVVVPVGASGAKESFAASTVLLAADLLGGYAKDLGYEDADAARASVVKTVTGSELGGVRFEPLFDYFTDTEKWGTENAWQILVDDYVSTEDGTGLVHQAPAYGEDDKRLSDAAGIPTIVSLADDGTFLSIVPDFEGVLWLDANMDIVRRLRADGRLLRLQSYEHSYPHCWRCRNRRQGRHACEQRADHLDPGERQARPVRQVARGCARLVDQPQPVLGLADPGLEERRSEPPAHRRVRIVRGDRARFRPTSPQREGRAGSAPPVHRRPDAPEPRRSHGQVDDAPHRGRLRRVVRLGLDALRAGALPL
jgi:hypothetical protein